MRGDRGHAYHFDVGGEGVHVGPDVNSSILKDLHAVGVVLCGINVVDTDRVGTELFHEVGVTTTLFLVEEGITSNELVRNT